MMLSRIVPGWNGPNASRRVGTIFYILYDRAMTNSNTCYTVTDGYSCCGGITDRGWYAGVFLLEDRDREFTEDIDGTDRKVRLLPGMDFDEWEGTMVDPPRRIALIDNFGGTPRREIVAEAERIFGPVTVREKTAEPLLVWTELRDGLWRLMVRRGIDSSVVYESTSMLRAPAVTLAGESLFAACETELDGQTGILVMTVSGDILLEIPGGAPELAWAGKLILLSEIKTNDGGIELRLSEIAAGGSPRHTRVRSGDLNMFGNLVADTASGEIYVCWESTPSWGYDPYVGRHREINLWSCRPGGEIAPVEGTCNGKLPVPQEAYVDGHDSNMPPVRPKVVLLGDAPAVAYRRFRYRERRCFGWDVYLMRRENGIWSDPRRINDGFGPPDAGYSVHGHGEGLIGFFPCCDNEPGSRRTYNHRVEILEVSAAGASPRNVVPVADRGFYVVPFGVEDPAPDPPPDPTGRRLIWGDIHSHSFNSKCICSINGSPEDVLRYQRDILGCSVLTLTDHTHHMGAQEFAWQLDRLEAFAGGNRLVLYSCEPGTMPGHHTNFYALDRRIFERLRPIVLAYWDRGEMYSVIKERLPAGSVLALRHFHGFSRGPFDINSEATVQTWDPGLEVAMEAMQVRGNILLGQALEPTPRFPGNFLDAGAKIGLVGGSDHSTGKSPNHYCLTGFWIEEYSIQGVWDAIVNRRTVACSNGKISLWTEMAGLPMGSEVSVQGTVSVRVRISAPRRIRRICLIRDGEPLEWTTVDSDSAEIELEDGGAKPGRHWYVATAEGESAFGDLPDGKGPAAPAIAHGSPYFVEVT